jgi:hypothetical protein
MLGRRALIGLGLSLPAMMASCGPGSGNGRADGGGDSGGVTSVSASQPLNALTSAQIMQLCADVAAYVAQIPAADKCKIGGVSGAIIARDNGTATTDAQLQSACMSAVNLCPGNPQDGGTCDIGDTSTCAATATVSEYTTCLSDLVTGTEQVASTLPTRSTLTASSVSAADSALAAAADPASCVKLMTDCPNLKVVDN